MIYPVVQFPSPAEMSEEDFHAAAAQAWPQLLAEHVSNQRAESVARFNAGLNSNSNEPFWEECASTF